MNRLYLDTSAFFKTFVEEEASEVVERLILLAKENKIEIILSDWVINESFALVDKNRRKERISQVQAQNILSEIVSMMSKEVQYENFTVYPITDKILITSRFAIQEYHIAASDALHVFISAVAECDCFISADEDLIHQLKSGASTLLAFNIRIEEDVNTLFNLVG